MKSQFCFILRAYTVAAAIVIPQSAIRRFSYWKLVDSISVYETELSAIKESVHRIGTKSESGDLDSKKVEIDGIVEADRIGKTFSCCQMSTPHPL